MKFERLIVLAGVSLSRLAESTSAHKGADE